MTKVAIDTAVLAAILDTHDKWNSKAIPMYTTFADEQIAFVYFDSVINEVISVLSRRMGEQKRIEQFETVLAKLTLEIPTTEITWISLHTQEWFPEIVDLVKQHKGVLNFHDAMIALACKKANIQYIASFDRDFGMVH